MIILVNLVAAIACSFIAVRFYKKKTQHYVFVINLGAALLNAYWVVVYIIKHL